MANRMSSGSSIRWTVPLISASLPGLLRIDRRTGQWSHGAWRRLRRSRRVVHGLARCWRPARGRRIRVSGQTTWSARSSAPGFLFAGRTGDGPVSRNAREDRAEHLRGKASRSRSPRPVLCRRRPARRVLGNRTLFWDLAAGGRSFVRRRHRQRLDGGENYLETGHILTGRQGSTPASPNSAPPISKQSWPDRIESASGRERWLTEQRSGHEGKQRPAAARRDTAGRRSVPGL